MPHLTIEYSSNLTPRLDVRDLVDSLHAAALDTGLFAVGGLRTRAAERGHYRVADGHPDNAFVHVVLRVGQGRDADTRRTAGERLFARICEILGPLYDTTPLAISFEVQEIDASMSFKRNNLHEIVRRRREASP